MEWQASIHLNFIYFKKAFDSVHCATLWKLLKPYDILQAKIRIIEDLYRDFTCSVLHQGNLPFAVETGKTKMHVVAFTVFDCPRLGFKGNNESPTYWD